MVFLLLGVFLMGILLPEFFSAISRGTVKFPVSANLLSAVGCTLIASYFVYING